MNPLLRKAARRVETAMLKLCVQPWRANRSFEEKYLGRLLQRLEVDCVLDVGANIGQYALMLREYCGFKGRIISFEPTPDVFATLQENARHDPLWNPQGVALGRVQGTTSFNVLAGASVGNSFRSMTAKDAGDHSFKQVSVQVERLSELLPRLREQYGFSRPFLKMDTQGFDLEVFAGAEGVLDDIIGLQSELSVAPFYEGAPGWLEAIETYQKAGFVLSSFFPTDDWLPHLREIDCVMFRPSKLR